MNDSSSPLPPDTIALSRKDRIFLGLLQFFGRRSLRLLQAFGRVIGWLAMHVVNNSRRRTVQRNLELCFPEQSADWVKTTTARSLVSMTQTMAEFTKAWHEPPAYSIQQIRHVHGEEIFHEALAQGRGTIAIVPHYGTWEFMNAWFSQYTAPIIMYKPAKQKGVDAFVRTARSRLNSIAVPTDERGVKALFKGLKQNGFTAILPDHIPHEGGGIFAPFFGIPTWTGVMVPKLISRTQCAVIVMYCLRRPDADGFDLHFEKPDPDIWSEDLATATAAMNRSMEQVIRRDPAHYQWSYKRFKKCQDRPDPYS